MRSISKNINKLKERILNNWFVCREYIQSIDSHHLRAILLKLQDILRLVNIILLLLQLTQEVI